MNEFYIGGRATGKTYTLLNRANEIANEGRTPVFIGYNSTLDYIKHLANRMNIDISNFEFVAYQPYFRDVLSKINTEKCTYFIDELPSFINFMLQTDSICATIPEEECKMINK